MNDTLVLDSVPRRRRMISTAGAIWFAMGVMTAIIIGWIVGDNQAARLESAIQHTTQAQADASLVRVNQHMPNTHFTAAAVDPQAPGLVRLTVGGKREPVWFDPLRHYLIIGLVVDMAHNAPPQHIAGGFPVGDAGTNSVKGSTAKGTK